MTQPALPTDSIHLTQPGDACAEYILSTHNFPRIHYSLALTHTLTNVLMRGKHRGQLLQTLPYYRAG